MGIVFKESKNVNINLGVQWEEFVSGYVRSGRYLSASEVVREGLRLLQEREQIRQVHLETLRGDIAAGMKQLDDGAYDELDATTLRHHLQAVKARGRRRLAKDNTSKAS